jgi:hypothetical protein
VLGAPLTFVLSQDQTLQLNLEKEGTYSVKSRFSYLGFASAEIETSTGRSVLG